MTYDKDRYGDGDHTEIWGRGGGNDVFPFPDMAYSSLVLFLCMRAAETRLDDGSNKASEVRNMASAQQHRRGVLRLAAELVVLLRTPSQSSVILQISTSTDIADKYSVVILVETLPQQPASASPPRLP